MPRYRVSVLVDATSHVAAITEARRRADWRVVQIPGGQRCSVCNKADAQDGSVYCADCAAALGEEEAVG